MSITIIIMYLLNNTRIRVGISQNAVITDTHIFNVIANETKAELDNRILGRFNVVLQGQNYTSKRYYL